MTSAAMGLSFYGKMHTPDELLKYCDENGLDRHDLAVISQVIRHFGVSDSAGYNDTLDEIKAHLAGGNPVIVQGSFTPSGHVILVLGVDEEKGVWICDDPAGDHKIGYGIGEKDGDHVEYPGEWFDPAAAPDGKVWAHLLSAA